MSALAGIVRELMDELALERADAAGWTSLPWLHRVTAPTLIVTGDDDPSVPVGNARMLAARLPNARVHVLAGGGHLFLLDALYNAIALIVSLPRRALVTATQSSPAHLGPGIGAFASTYAITQFG